MNKKRCSKNKKGQLLSQPFTYIFALVVVAMIVSLGFYLITRTTKIASDVDVAKFKIDFEKKVLEISYLTPGSGDDVNMVAPTGVNGVCFLDMKAGSLEVDKIKFSDIKNDVELFLEAEKTSNNMFFSITKGKTASIKSVQIPKLKPKTNPLCVEFTSGRMKVGLENKGKYVEVSV